MASATVPSFFTTPLGNFLKSRKTYKGAPRYNEWTITGINEDYDKGVYIVKDDEMEEFLRLANNHIYVRGWPCSLLQRHRNVGPLLIDLDFKYEGGGALRRRFGDAHLKRFVAQYAAAMVYLSRVEALSHENLDFYVTLKPLPESEVGKQKDGLHIQCPTIFTEPKFQFGIRGFLQQQEAIRTTFGDTGFINPTEKVFDASVIYRNNWFIYGASKPNKAQYALTHIWSLPIASVREMLAKEEGDGYDDPASFEELVGLMEEVLEATPLPTPLNPRELMRMLDIRSQTASTSLAIRPIRSSEWEELMIAWGDGKDKPATGVRGGGQAGIRNALLLAGEDEELVPAGGAGMTGGGTEDQLTVVGDEENITPQSDIALAYRLCRECLNAERRAGEYQDWINLAICLKNLAATEESFKVWCEVTRNVDPSHKKATKTDAELRAKWNLIRVDGTRKLGMGSLQHWAAEDNPEKHRSILSETLTDWIIHYAKETHVNIATLVFRMYRHEFRCCLGARKGEYIWYQYPAAAHSWHHLRTPIELRMRLSSRVKDEYIEAWRKLGKRDLATEEARKENEGRRKLLHQIENKLENNGYKDSVLKECQEKFYDDEFINKLNSDPNLVGVANGVIELKYWEREGVGRPHVHFRDGRPDDYVSFMMGGSDGELDPVSYVPYDSEDATQKELAAFFERIYPDAVLREYVLTLLSSCLEGANREQKFYVMQGRGGNGKSMIELLMELTFGDYGTSLSTTVFTRKRPDSGAANPDIITVQKRRYIHTGEPDDNERINTAIMKAWTGGDRLCARGLFADQEKFSITGKIFMSCNELPPVSKMDGGTWRRLRVIPHVSTFKDPGDPAIDPAKNIYPKDLHLEAKLRHWRTAFLSLLVHYYETRYLEHGLKEPDCVVAASNEYKEDNDMFSRFVAENFIMDKACHVPLYAKDVRDIFRDWKKALGRECDLKEASVMERMRELCGSGSTKTEFWGIRVADETVAGPMEDLSGAFPAGTLTHV
jgi:P4 family phage/plasmid primase-like protien